MENELIEMQFGFDLAASALAIIIMALVFVAMLNKALLKIRKQARSDLQRHQEWLFKQLYSMAPGKVLEPEALEEVIESKPAMVYSPDEDPYSEFNGTRDDWHGQN